MGFSRKKGGHVKFDWKSISATGGVQFFFWKSQMLQYLAKIKLVFPAHGAGVL